ncbi:MAG TPA: M48 family metalloprotease [Caulobacteraceae bacterium]|nr:M48 family metalloprotease [Caulobacteraceae bacterium]
MALIRPRHLRSLIGAVAGVSLLAASAPPAKAQEGAPISLIRDTEVEEILHKECDPIFAAADINPAEVKIHIVNDGTLNAFTAGGLNIFLNTGLIIQTDDPDQLIGVVAHETGHMAGGDVAHSGAMGHAGLGPLLLGLGLGALAAAAGAPDAAAGLVYSGSYFAAINELGYSREQESRADAAAVTYLEKAGYSGKGLVDFFNKFRYQEVFSDDRKFPFWRDHPLTDERIDALAVRVAKEPHYNVVDSPEAKALHEVMKAKLVGFLDQPMITFQVYPPSDKSFPARYARAIAYYKENETATAVAKIDELIVERPTDPYLYELKGQVLFEAGRAKEAEPPFRKSVELKPDAPLLRINLAQALLAENDPQRVDEAISDLHLALGAEQDNPLGWRLLAEAYDSKGEQGMARLAAAEQNFNLGQMKDARIFAFRARELLKKNSPEWRRATDIFLASDPSKDDMKVLGSSG